jgi:DNA-binding transcriptional regulator PaaX
MVLERTDNLSEKEREALLKDYHLVRAAMTFDKIVISLDDTTEEILRKIVVHVTFLGQLMWVNPTRSFDSVKSWLEETSIADSRWLIAPPLSRSRPKRAKRLDKK